LIVDEPIANLDEESAGIIRETLEEHVEENKNSNICSS
jgi:ABC-type multidrug transport system ATPase subunit